MRPSIKLVLRDRCDASARLDEIQAAVSVAMEARRDALQVLADAIWATASDLRHAIEADIDTVSDLAQDAINDCKRQIEDGDVEEARSDAREHAARVL